MLKKFFLASLLLFTIFTVQASQTLCLPQGFYFGLGASETYFNLSNKYIFDPGKVENTNFYNRSNSLNRNSASPDFLLGFSQSFQQYFLAAELNANFSQWQLNANTAELTTQNQFLLDNMFSLVGRLGYIMGNTMPYGLAGAVYTKLTRRIIFDDDGIFSSLGIAPVNLSHDVWGGMLGVGIEQRLSCHWHVALEYNHTFYQDTNFPMKNQIFTFLGQIGTNQISLKSNTVMLKLLFYV